MKRMLRRKTNYRLLLGIFSSRISFLLTKKEWIRLNKLCTITRILCFINLQRLMEHAYWATGGIQVLLRARLNTHLEESRASSQGSLRDTHLKSKGFLINRLESFLDLRQIWLSGRKLNIVGSPMENQIWTSTSRSKFLILWPNTRRKR